MPLEIRNHLVQTTITGQVATTEVDQVFYNPSGSRLEGTYLFPIPKGAAIDRFAMEIDGKLMEAELLDAAKAKKIYEDIVRSMRDPALMEYVGQGLFKVRIFPIEPRSEKRVTLKYSEVLSRDGGLTTYRYPLNTEKFSAAPIEKVAISVRIESNHAMNTIYSPTHEVEVKQGGDHAATVGFESNHVKPDRDFLLYFGGANGDEVNLSIITHREPGEEEGYFLMLASPGDVSQDSRTIPKDVVFAFDASGSMSGPKIDQARRALRMGVGLLNEGDRFELIRFSTEAQPLFGELTLVNDTSLAEAHRFIDRMKAMGGTAIDDALTLAARTVSVGEERDRPAMIVFLTDGRPTVGRTANEEIESRLKAGLKDRPARVFCFGVGHEVNAHLLDRVSQATQATTIYVSPDEDIELRASAFWQKTSQPVLTNLAVAADGPLRLSSMYPAALPDLFAGEQLFLLGRYRDGGNATVTLTGQAASQTQTISMDHVFPREGQDAHRPFVASLWATRQVAFLLDQIRLNGETAELRDEVTRLARRHGIVTPYTAYLIVEDDRRIAQASGRTMFDSDTRAAANESVDEFGDSLREQSGRVAFDVAESTAGLRQNRSAVAGPKAAAPISRRLEQFERESAQRGDAGRAVTLAKARLTLTRPRLAGGKTFYASGDRWIDAQAIGVDNLPKQTIVFASPSYFELIEAFPEAGPWLAVGDNITLVMDHMVYEISRAAEE